jgi:DNA-binding MarR family transcriptional regulator
MTEINADIFTRGQAISRRMATQAARTPVAVEPELIAFGELLFFAYRDFTRDADRLLAEFGLGRAHHRLLHFVNRAPGLTVADLLDILKITKQSLARVLKHLVGEGWVEQRVGEDRRRRLLFATAKGQALALRLLRLQSERVAAALQAGSSATAVHQFLFAMMNEEERTRVEALLPTIDAAKTSEWP